MSQNSWQWDASRGQHYYFSSDENAYVYENGLRVYPSGTNQTEYSPRGSVHDAGQAASAAPYSAGSNTGLMHVTEQLGNLNIASERTHPQWSAPNVNQSQNFYQRGQQWAGSTSQYDSPQGRTANSQGVPEYWLPRQTNPIQYPNQYYQGAQYPSNHGGFASGRDHRTRRDSQQTQASSNQQIIVANVKRGPAEVITDPAALREGAQATARVYPGEKLDARYRVRRPGWEFFTIGKVFKLLWPEPAGDCDTTDVTEDNRFGEPIFCKIRWFIVVKEGSDCSTCVPIQTYGKRGTTKPHLRQLEHSIVFTGKNSPKPLPGEDRMLPPIRVKAKNRGDKLQRESRINFGKVYTVEHNCKVYDFGDVHPDYIDNLSQCWRWVLTQNTVSRGQGQNALGTIPREGEDAGGEGEYNDDDYDDDDAEYDDEYDDGDDEYEQ